MEKDLIAITQICSHYDIAFSFIDSLYQMELIQIKIVQQDWFINQEQVGHLEKMIRIHKDLNVNLEGIDIVFNLLEKEKELREELDKLRNKLRLYEGNNF